MAVNTKLDLMEGLTRRQIERSDSKYITNSISRAASEHFISRAPEWVVYKRATPFTRRITGMSWHPQLLDVVALGSHGGDVFVWNMNNPEKDVFIQGQGPGGSITEMVFHPTNHRYIYTTSVNGTFSLLDLEGRHSEVFLDTMDWRFWYCALCLSSKHTVMFAGSSYGEGSLVSNSGTKIGNYRLHKKKIQHASFVPNSDELFITASNDYTIKLWDVRMLSSDRPTPILTYNTPAASNSAYFDPHTGSLLLATCQNSQILVFSINPSTAANRPISIINHHHKFFQHLTPIKATWHPLYTNLAVIGRYGGVDEESGERFVDIVDWEKRQVVGKLRDMTAMGVVSLNEFNASGDKLVSGMGQNGLVWHRKASMDSTLPASFKVGSSATLRRQRRNQRNTQQTRQNRKQKKDKFLDSHSLTKSQSKTLSKKLNL